MLDLLVPSHSWLGPQPEVEHIEENCSAIQIPFAMADAYNVTQLVAPSWVRLNARDLPVAF